MFAHTPTCLTVRRASYLGTAGGCLGVIPDQKDGNSDRSVENDLWFPKLLQVRKIFDCTSDFLKAACQTPATHENQWVFLPITSNYKIDCASKRHVGRPRRNCRPSLRLPLVRAPRPPFNLNDKDLLSVCTKRDGQWNEAERGQNYIWENKKTNIGQRHVKRISWYSKCCRRAATASIVDLLAKERREKPRI